MIIYLLIGSTIKILLPYTGHWEAWHGLSLQSQREGQMNETLEGITNYLY